MSSAWATEPQIHVRVDVGTRRTDQAAQPVPTNLPEMQANLQRYGSADTPTFDVTECNNCSVSANSSPGANVGIRYHRADQRCDLSCPQGHFTEGWACLTRSGCCGVLRL